MYRLLISTGEVSGDLQGSFLIDALYRQARERGISLEILALGGPRMKAAGAYLISDTASMGAIGIIEAIPFIIPTFKAQSKLNNLIKNKKLDGLVLIDYMGPNIRLGNKLRNAFSDLPITYYIAPQEWAWSIGDGGTTDLIGFTDQILAIFQAEADFYSDRGGNVTWVGHPMLDTLEAMPSRVEALSELNLSLDSKVLLLFPASRSQELRYLMPTLARVAAKLQKYDPSIYVIVPAGLPSFEETLNNILNKEGIRGRVVSAKEVDCLKKVLFAAASLALGKSGTINMELALNGVPQIVGYKLSRFTAFLAKQILRFEVDHISPVNLILKERLIPEFIQDDLTEEKIFRSALPLLNETKERKDMLFGYEKLKNILGEKGVTDRAANKILDLLK